MPEIEIRPATAADINVLSKIEHSYTSDYVWQMDRLIEEGQTAVTFREVRLPRSVKVDYPPRFSFASREQQSNTAILAAIIVREPVGYICIGENQLPEVGWVTDLAVRPDLRRQGIATALVLAAQDWAVTRGLRRIICEMQSKNHAAIKLMGKLGYEFCGYNDYYYANKDIALFFTRFMR